MIAREQMANFYLKKLTGSVVEIDDLGIEITGVTGTVYDLSSENASDVAISIDLVTAVQNGDLGVVDPRDSTTVVENRSVLSTAESIKALDSANTPHYGVVGGRLGSIDDPTVTLNTNTYLKFDNVADEFVTVTAGDIISDDSSVNEIQNVIEGSLIAGDDVDITVAAGTGNGDKTFTVGVTDGRFLRADTDDILENVLTVSSSGSIDVQTGSMITVADEPLNPTDVANKAYVDASRAGLDAKESVLVATVADLSSSAYNPSGGTGTGEISGAPTTLDGISLSVGNRILVKDQADPKQNGIYVVDDLGTGANGLWVRAEDQNGDPVEDVSAGNFTLVEEGTYKNTGWVLQGQGIITLNTDDLVWVKINAANEYIAGEGLELDTLTFSLDFNSLTSQTANLSDEIAFYDVTEAGHSKSTFTDFFSDLNVPFNITNNGFVAKDGSGDFVSRILSSSADADKAGISVSDGDGVNGNPTIGLDINGLNSGTAIDLNNDAVVIYNAAGQENFKYSIQDILDLGATTDSFSTWNIGGNQSGDTSLIATSSTETINITGGNGIALTANNTTKSLDLSITKDGLVGTAVELTDSILVFDTSDSDSAKSISFQNLFDDLGVIQVTTSGTGIITKVSDTGSETDFAVREIESSLTSSNLGGISVTNGDLVAGNAEIGLDINSLDDSVDILNAVDEFATYDASATKNVSMTGQQVADGVADILGFGDIEVSVIDSQSFLTLADSTRGNKQLSVDSTEFVFSENRLNPNNWINIGSSVNSFNGYVVPFDGTVVYATSSCDEASGDYDLEVYVNGSSQGVAVSYAQNDNNETRVNNTLNIDVSQGDRIRVRAVNTNGTGRLEDTVISLFVKWRAGSQPAP